MSLLQQIKTWKNNLRQSKTVVTTASGLRYVEKIQADGTSVTSQLESSKYPGYVLDTKPDLQVADVLPGLCMGSQDVAHDIDLMKKHCITHILSLCIHPIQQSKKFNYKHVTIYDTPEWELKPHLKECFSFIDKARKSKKGCVLVHCNAGVSRSAAVVIAYLMKVESLSYEEAFLHLKERRKVIRPNPGFVKQLLEYEKFLKGNCKDTKT